MGSEQQRREGSNMSYNFEEAVRTLNTLQSNAATLERIKSERDRKRFRSIPDTIEQAERAGVKLDDIDRLSVIHVSGTKGKGSTCAYCESILRAHGFKTGFFSSPHLVEVRERIRIDGRPLSKDAFSSYFWDCYKQLDESKSAYEDAMPAYFRFLTIMAFHVFVQEKVDVAIMEVGIGGMYDCTNIVRVPVVCGVSSLGIDHTSILGDTIDKIAWHKAGIFKKGVPAISVPQPDNSIEVLKEKAQEIECPLQVAPPFESYPWATPRVTLGIPGTMQTTNASLAVQLCNIWLKDHNKTADERRRQYAADEENGGGDVGHLAKPPTITGQIATGLDSTLWPGRNQTIKHPGLSYYIDGAHTPRSITACADWFVDASATESKSTSGKVVRVLLFNTTGDRHPEDLLMPLVPCGFDFAVFCPNIHSSSGNIADQVNHTVSMRSQLARCTVNRNAWLEVLKSPVSADAPASTGSEVVGDAGDVPVKAIRLDTDDSGIESGTDSSCSSTRTSPESDPMPTFTFNTIQDALTWITQGRDPELTSPAERLGTPEVLVNCDHIQVLCTGSLHLVGGVLGMVDPSLTEG